MFYSLPQQLSEVKTKHVLFYHLLRFRPAVDVSFAVWADFVQLRRRLYISLHMSFKHHVQYFCCTTTTKRELKHLLCFFEFCEFQMLLLFATVQSVEYILPNVICTTHETIILNSMDRLGTMMSSLQTNAFEHPGLYIWRPYNQKIWEFPAIGLGRHGRLITVTSFNMTANRQSPSTLFPLKPLFSPYAAYYYLSFGLSQHTRLRTFRIYL